MSGMASIKADRLFVVMEQTIAAGRLEHAESGEWGEHLFYYTVFLSLYWWHRKAGTGTGLPSG
jgi:hypothetical protein